MAITKTEKIWMDGELIDWDDANVHILTHTLHYGLGVFEGIRAYATADGPGVFRLTDHITRLFNSARDLHDRYPFQPGTDSGGGERDRGGKQAPGMLYQAPRLSRLRGNGPEPSAIPRPGGRGRLALGRLSWAKRASRRGVRVKISSWQRHDPNAMPPAAKGAGMYINSSMAKVEALKAGYDEAILLSPQGYVSECTGENIFVYRNDRLITPPVSAGALEGITQDSVLTIARDLGIDVEFANVLRSDLYTADEAFLTGTAAEVVPSAPSMTGSSAKARPGPLPVRSRRSTRRPCGARSTGTGTGSSMPNEASETGPSIGEPPGVGEPGSRRNGGPRGGKRKTGSRSSTPRFATGARPRASLSPWPTSCGWQDNSTCSVSST